jgi:biotin carboxyl carrier protein
MSRTLLDPDTLQHLFRHLEATDVDELEVVWGDKRLFVRRDPGRRTTVEERGADASSGAPIVAPLTGVFYSRPSPEQPGFVELGDHIEPGQVVALIETMKLFNEVQADIGGEVTSMTARDGDLVEAGQALMYVRPQEGLEET